MTHDPSRAHLRLLIAARPDDAPRGAVSRFCREHGVSREWFYSTRKHLNEAGLPEALAPRSSRPKKSPAKVPDLTERLALEARTRLGAKGWDNGPISVKYELETLGIASPSRATLARIFTRNGFVTAQPKKRPKSSSIRFEYAAPNELWQLVATAYTLAWILRAMIIPSAACPYTQQAELDGPERKCSLDPRATGHITPWPPQAQILTPASSASTMRFGRG